MPAATPPDAHLCLVHPLGDVAALGLLDTALALRDDLHALGVRVSLARQRLRADAVNIVLGVEHGWDAEAARGHCCLLLNTVPLREGGGRMPAAALRQLRRFPVVDVDPASLAHRQARAAAPGTAPAPLPASALWLPGPLPAQAAAAPALAERPIALLMTGAPTARQAALLAGLAQAGIAVARLDQPLAGPELAAMRTQARAVLCLLAEDDAPPDLLTMALALRQGTPVLAERPGNGSLPDAPPASAVMWFEPTGEGLAAALKGGANGPAFAAAGAESLRAFVDSAPAEPARALWTLALSAWAQQAAKSRLARPSMDPATDAVSGRATGMLTEPYPGTGDNPLRPDRLCVTAPGQPHRPGWWHVASAPSAAADEVLDLNQPLPTPWAATAGRWTVIDAGLWTPQSHRLPVQALHLLTEGGRLVLHCPLSALGWHPTTTTANTANTANTATQAAAAVQAALAPWTTAFWLSGLVHQHLVLDHLGWLDTAGRPVPAEQAHSVRLVLVRQDTSYQQRSLARAMAPDFGLSGEAWLSAA